MRSIFISFAALALLVAPAAAQTIVTPGGTATGSAMGYGPKDGQWTPVTPASPLPVSATGTDGTTARSLRTDARGGLIPAQGVVASTRTTLTASTATALEATGVAGRTLESVAVETTLSAPVYICTTQTTSCSATAYDFLIPNSAGAGTIFTPPFATTGRLYAWSTGTPTLVLNSWTAP